MRTCEKCGQEITQGFTTDEGDFYCCEECFEEYMDSTYGKHRWMEINDDGCGGYYISTDDSYVGGYYGTGIYWTEWEDESEE